MGILGVKNLVYPNFWACLARVSRIQCPSSIVASDLGLRFGVGLFGAGFQHSGSAQPFGSFPDITYVGTHGMGPFGAGFQHSVSKQHYVRWPRVTVWCRPVWSWFSAFRFGVGLFGAGFQHSGSAQPCGSLPWVTFLQELGGWGLLCGAFSVPVALRGMTKGYIQLVSACLSLVFPHSGSAQPFGLSPCVTFLFLLIIYFHGASRE